MSIYGFWNNKGGTGKTSLSFQSICRFAEINPSKRILAIDLCPQANLSELFLGGLTGRGGQNLNSLHSMNPRKSVAGYFETRLPSPFSRPSINFHDFVCEPSSFNSAIPDNVMLLAGDPLVELQANAIATLANTQIPGTDTWIAVIDWLRDFITECNGEFDDIFIDANPSFSVYTQIALASVDRLVLPVMADDSSRRAIQNMFNLIHGINIPSSSVYTSYAFSSKLAGAGRHLPQVHLVVKNRITQYMGAASAYSSVLRAIDQDLQALLSSHSHIFSFTSITSGMVVIRDFQTTGVVAFAEGMPFSKLRVGMHDIIGKPTRVNLDMLTHCQSAIDSLVNKL